VAQQLPLQDNYQRRNIFVGNGHNNSDRVDYDQLSDDKNITDQSGRGVENGVAGFLILDSG
jgi:hypothetical protein